MIAAYAWYCRCFADWPIAHKFVVEDTQRGDVVDVLNLMAARATASAS